MDSEKRNPSRFSTSIGGMGEHEGKGGGVGKKGTQQIEKLVMDEVQENHREDVRKLVEMMQKEEERLEKQRGRVAPNMEAGGSHLQAMSVPERKEIRRMRWADCENDERKEEGQEELMSEKQSGLEQKEESEHERKEEEEKRAQEAREEERRVQEAREEQRRAQEAREEQRRAQEARENLRRAQDAREPQEERVRKSKRKK